MSSSFLKNFCMTGAVLSLAAAGAFLAVGRSDWAAGIVVGAFWMFLNLFFLFRLMEIGLGEKTKRKKDHILLYSILKFPVLYVAGFFVLTSRVFPAGALLVGLSIFFFAFMLLWLWFNVVSKSAEKVA